MNRRFPAPRTALAGALALSLLSAAGGARALTLYDDFSGSLISPGKWTTSQSQQYGAITGEERRAIQSGQLRLEARGWSDRYSNGGAGRVRNSVVFVNSPLITTMKATLTVHAPVFGLCAGNTSNYGVMRARLFGFFFNAGDALSGNSYNDVYATIVLSRVANTTDATGVLHMIAAYGVCTDDQCINSTQLGSSDMGTATVDTPTDVQVTWDKVNKQFSFAATPSGGATATVNLGYSWNTTKAPTNDAKRIELANDIPNCTAARAATFGSVDVDNVYTN